MPTSLYMPDVTVEIAFDSGYSTPAGSRTWTDVSAYVEAAEGIQITRGRPDEVGQVQPSRLTLTLDNRDGRFTPGKTGGAYYPNVKKGRPIRVRAVHDSVTYDRFLGYVDEWPVVWPDGTDAHSTVTVTASSRRARLANSTELRSIVEETHLQSDLWGYWPLGEPQGATLAGNIAPGALVSGLEVTQRGNGGTLVFGAGTGPGTDGLTAPVLTPANADNGKFLKGSLVTPTVTLPICLEAFVNWSGTVNQTILSLHSPSTGAELSLSVVAGGYLKIIWGPPGSTRNATSVTVKLTSGQTHHVSARLLSGSVVRFEVDGVSEIPTPGAGTSGLSGFVDIRVGAPRYLYAAEGLFGGTISHVAVTDGIGAADDAVLTAHADSGITGFAGDSTGMRIERLAAFAGIPTAEINADPGSTAQVAAQETTGKTPLALMGEVEATENGVLYDGRDGALEFRSRDSRYGAASAFTLDAGVQAVEADLEPKLDDQQLMNDVTASRAGGVTARAVDQDSVDDYGPYRETIELITLSDDEVGDAANWRVTKYAEPAVRIPSVTVDLINSSTSVAAAVLAADLGTKFTLTGLPSQAPSSSLSFFVEGTTETIGAESYRVGFNVSPGSLGDVWTLEDGTFGALGTYPLAY